MRALAEKFVIIVGIGTVALLAMILLPKFDTPLADSLGSGIATFLHFLGIICLVIIGLVLVIVAAVAFVRIKQMGTTHVIYDPKDGQPVRAVIHKGQIVQMAPAGLDITEIMKMQQQQIMQTQQQWKMIATAMASMKNMATIMEQYVVDADEGDEEDDLTIGEATPPKQIDAPRTQYQPQNIVTMHLSDDCLVPADDFLSGRKLIAGISGSGKSNTVGTYGEELGRLRVPFVLGDTEDEYQPLCNPRWLPNGVLAGLGTQYPVNVENAAQFGEYVLTHRLQVILNLQSYEMEEAALVMIGIIGGMREWEQALPNDQRIPCDFLLEEAVTWLPQNIKESPLYGTETFNMLQSTFFNDMVRKGRKRGLGLTVVCQKIAELDKRAMQSDGKILHRQTEPRDLECYKKFGIPPEITPFLADGECFLFSSHLSWKRVQIRQRQSPHGAKTPGIANLQKQRNPDENREISASSGKPFEQDTEPLREAFAERSETRQASVQTVPEDVKKAILGLYREGFKRTDIQAQLNINGDEYWMIKTVCNEYDQQKQKGSHS